MKRFPQIFLFIGAAALTYAPHVWAQPGAVDLSFDAGSGVNGSVWAIAQQPDGKLIVGGDFQTVRGLARRGIARLNADGSGDASFNPGPGTATTAYSVALQPDGKVLMGGYNLIARLNANGSLDSSFNPGTGPDYLFVYALALQSDGKVLIGGNFTTVNGTNRNRIARLNADGSLDGSFDPGIGADNDVWSIAVQPDDKVLVGGYFTTINGTNRNRIARLNADGSLDSAFNPGGGANSFVNCIGLQSDGKLLIGGDFTTVNGTNRNYIARLNTDGRLDSSFNPGTGTNGSIGSVRLQPDGRILIGGSFTTVNGTIRSSIARLNADGTLDSSFNPSAGANSYNNAIALRSDGRILIGGSFTTVNGTIGSSIARLNDDGSLDSGFNPSTGVDDLVNSVAVQLDGKALIGGYFTTVGGVTRNHIARLNTDGRLDSSFNPGTGTNGSIGSVRLQPDGKVLIGGFFSLANGTNLVTIARLNADGTLDSSFNPSAGANSYNNAIALQSDGRVLIGGDFTAVSGTNRNRIARLNADGSLDNSFDPGAGANDSIGSVALQPDGKVLIGGRFTSFNGTNRNHIARLNADGSLDSNFDPGSVGEAGVSSVVVQSDGKVLFGGGIEAPNGPNRNGIARLNADGSLDFSFYARANDDRVLSLALQPDGKVLVAGAFTEFNSTLRSGVVRLNANGSLDGSFDPGTGATGPGYPGNKPVYSVALQPDGKVLIVGDFALANGYARWRVARLHGDAPQISPLIVSNGLVTLNWGAISGRTYSVQVKPDLNFLNWTNLLPDIIAQSNGASKTDTTADPQRFYRVVLLP